MKLGSIGYLFAILSTAVVAPSAAWAHCWNYSEVASAAHEFSVETEHFHELIHDLTGFSHLAADAHRLAADADYFHQDEVGVDCSYIRSEFQHIASDYRHLERALQLADHARHNDHVMRDWEDVHFAFHNVEDAVLQSR